MSKHFPQLDMLHGNELFLGSWFKARQYILCSVWEKERKFFPAFFSILFCSVSRPITVIHQKKTFQLWKVPQEKFWRKNCLKSILLEGWSLLSGLSVQITDPPGKHYCTELQMWQLGGYNNICDICMPSNTWPSGISPVPVSSSGNMIPGLATPQAISQGGLNIRGKNIWC